MEDQERLSAPTRSESVFTKSPQELAAQLESVKVTFLEFTKHPEGKELDERYKANRIFVEKLLEIGISNEQLGEELGRLYEMGEELGIYSPLKGEKSDEFLARATEYYLAWGYSKDEAEIEAKKKISNEGYLAGLREWRRNYEKDIKKHFHDSAERHPLSETNEAERINQLKERVIYLADPEQTKKLAAEFPGGNFLHHGTNVEQAIGILESGSLFNTKALDDAEKERIEQEGGERNIIKCNSGYEGISWNYNKIEALPGDRYHLVGFLASPQAILTRDHQLAIPSRPAPHELILINRNIDSDKYYSLKTQQELLLSFGLGETNSVWSNIVQLSFFRQNETTGESNFFAKDSMLQSYIDNNIDDEKIAQTLQGLYSLRNDGTIEFSPTLLQQIEDAIPVAAVWLQALIDTGRIKNVQGFEDTASVRQVIKSINHEDDKLFLTELRKEKAYLENTIKEEEDKVTSLAIPVSEMYLVVPNTDLKKYLRIIARCRVQPKGILVYDHMDIRLENFTSTHKGDNEAMTEILRTAIPRSNGYIDYEQQILGIEITPDKMAGYKRHVIGEEFLEKRKTLRKNDQGEIIVI